MADRTWLLSAISAALIAATYVWAKSHSVNESTMQGVQTSLHRRTLLQVGGALTLLLAGLIYRIVYVSLIGARQISEMTGQDDSGETLSNVRTATRSLSERRGAIRDRNGIVLVESVGSGDNWRRQHSVTSAPHVLGYFSPLRFGLSGLESSRDGDLAGSDPLTIEEALDSLLFRRLADGHDVVCSIDSDLQALAADLLASSVGSAILIEARTGAILAMASSPGFNASDLTTNQDSDVDAASEAWNQIEQQPDQPLLFRATTGLYPPGSTFKVLTAAAGIDSGVITDETVFTDNGSLEIDGRVIPEYNRPDESRTEWTVRDGLVWSLNVVYAQIGLEIGAERFRQYARAFGIGQEIDFEFGVAPGQLASDGSDLDNPNALADTAFGQGALLVTPLHMARVMMAIANDGRIARPTLVREVRDSAGDAIWTNEPTVQATPISPTSAATVLDMLYDSVSFGYASGAQISGLTVAGKTGTAESGQDVPHGWFIGSAGVDSPDLVVAVCLDYGGEGGGLPLQIGRALLDAGMSR